MASSPLASGGAHTVASATEVTNGFDDHEHDAVSIHILYICSADRLHFLFMSIFA